MTDLLLQGGSRITRTGAGSGDGGEGLVMFRSGFGKPIALKRSSVAKASSILGDDDGGGMEGKALLPADGSKFLRSLFQTASGRTIDILHDGIFRAKKLLEMEESTENSSFHGSRPSKLCKRYSGENLSSVESKRAKVCDLGSWDPTSASRLLPQPGPKLAEIELKKHNGELLHSQKCNFVDKPASVKFHTAGGGSISVSGESLKRARSLLGDPEVCDLLGDVNKSGSVISPCKDTSLLSEQNLQKTSLVHHEIQGAEHTPEGSIVPCPIFSEPKKSETSSSFKKLGSNLLQKFNIVECASGKNNKTPSVGLIDMKSTTSKHCIQKNGTSYDVRQLGMRKSILPFKKPRTSNFITPMVLKASTGALDQSTNYSCHRRRVSTRYPSHVPRPYMKEFLKVHLSYRSKSEHLPEQVRRMNPETAETYVFHGESRPSCGIEELSNLLVRCGASERHASKKWVANHYKWIVWKLACYERCSPKFCGKFLTVVNVIEELKYRYEREANHGHRSALKRILEGDMQASSLMVLCISAVWSNHSPKFEVQSRETRTDRIGAAARLQLTDGWYSIDAQLDMPLSRYLAAGKLFVGQKLRICGASLHDWSGPVSPHEASTASLFLHVNGTYKACWSDRLGLSRGPCTPLAFRCIKGDGGPVPRTLVGVMRIYPVLYREKLANGRNVVRSEKMEAKSLKLHEQRCSEIIQSIQMDFHRGIGVSSSGNYQDYAEAAKLMKLLDGATEPEVVMAEMTPEQLALLSTYRVKLEETNQQVLHNSIQKALSAAGLANREVTPFMRIRVVGLVKRSEPKIRRPEEGIITLWNPTEKQSLDLSEGQAYAISGLVPVCRNPKLLYLHARSSTITWQSLASSEREEFMPFFNPRESFLLSRLGEVPMSREFDTVALVLYVGEVCIADRQRRQWVFVTDGSVAKMKSGHTGSSLLAISFSAPCVEGDSELPVNYNVVNSIVGFRDLVMREKDQVNDLWVAEAGENSTYHLSFEHQATSHLKHSSFSVQRWAKNSFSRIESLKNKVLSIVGP
ncbi:hypothetical protein Droror1_Dr00027134 [Drosera rotundifolia]